MPGREGPWGGGEDESQIYFWQSDLNTVWIEYLVVFFMRTCFDNKFIYLSQYCFSIYLSSSSSKIRKTSGRIERNSPSPVYFHVKLKLNLENI